MTRHEMIEKCIEMQDDIKLQILESANIHMPPEDQLIGMAEEDKMRHLKQLKSQCLLIKTMAQLGNIIKVLKIG